MSGEGGMVRGVLVSRGFAGGIASGAESPPDQNDPPVQNLPPDCLGDAEFLAVLPVLGGLEVSGEVECWGACW